jgi:hypothetical protein
VAAGCVAGAAHGANVALTCQCIDVVFCRIVGGSADAADQSLKNIWLRTNTGVGCRTPYIRRLTDTQKIRILRISLRARAVLVTSDQNFWSPERSGIACMAPIRPIARTPFRTLLADPGIVIDLLPVLTDTGVVDGFRICVAIAHSHKLGG